MSNEEEHEIRVGICNSLNAQAGRFKYSDPWLSEFLLKTQRIIEKLLERLKNEN